MLKLSLLSGGENMFSWCPWRQRMSLSLSHLFLIPDFVPALNKNDSEKKRKKTNNFSF